MPEKSAPTNNIINDVLAELEGRPERHTLTDTPLGDPPMEGNVAPQRLLAPTRFVRPAQTASRSADDAMSQRVPPVHPNEMIPLAPRSVVLECVHNEEYGDGTLLQQLYQGRLVYDHAAKDWCTWAGHAWQRDRTGLAKQLVAGQVASQYLLYAAIVNKEAESESDKEQAAIQRALANRLIERALKLRKLNRVMNVLNFAQSLLGITGDEWDTHPWLLGVRNGVLDLRTGSLGSGRPEDYIRTVAPTEWKGLDVPAPRWEQYLYDLFEDTEDPYALIDFLQRLFGYGLTGLTREHVLPILWGPGGRNGKDTLLKAFERVLGPLAGAVSNDVVVAPNARAAGAAQPHLCDLQGKRLVWASETSEGARFNAAQVKYITGGGRIKTRPLYGNMIEFDPTYLLLLITNYKPHAPADDNALWERVKLIPFNMRFVDYPTAPNERQRDPALSEQLKQEASGILAWLVRGCMAWQHQGLNPPTSVDLATQEYKQEEDTLGLFIEERCVAAVDATVSASVLYATYKEWADEMNLRGLTGTAFGKRMSERFSKERRRGGFYYQGIGLLTDARFDDSSSNPTHMQNGAAQSAKSTEHVNAGVGSVGTSQDFPIESSSRETKIAPTLHTLHTLHTDESANGTTPRITPEKVDFVLEKLRLRGPHWAREYMNRVEGFERWPVHVQQAVRAAEQGGTYEEPVKT